MTTPIKKPCPHCEVEFNISGCYAQHVRSCSMVWPAVFWGRVDRSGGPDACWPFTWRLDALGYGRFESKGPLAFAHRAAYIASLGEIKKGMDVCHRCDNRRCCNPALLQGLHRQQGRGRNEWLFGRRLVVEQKIRDRIAKDAGMAKEGERGTLHRFRATMLTKFNRWRVPTEVQQRMAGHANPFEGSRAHYIPTPPTTEMHELAAKYAEHVQMCLLL